MQSSQGRSLPNTRASEIQYVVVSREGSSSATTSNFPGPSRVMGKLFSLLGAKLERCINLAADRFGYGPQALRRKLSKECDGLRWATRNMPVEERKKIIEKLMSYVSSGTSITQSQALELICDLILKDEKLAIRDEFLDAGLYVELHNLWLYCDMAQNQYQYIARRDPDIDILLASSRKALIFVEENEVHTVAKPFLNLDIVHRSYSDKLTMLSPLLHALNVLLRQSYLNEARNTPIGTLASAYCQEIYYVPRFILHSFYEADLRTESPVIPLPTEKIELCIRAYCLSLSLFLFCSSHIDRIFVRHCTFKSLTEERKLRYYSMVQYNVDYSWPQEPDIWDDIPLPTLPDKYSNVEMESISVTKVLVDLSRLDELQFSLPTGLDHAILHDTLWEWIFPDRFAIVECLLVWDIFSES